MPIAHLLLISKQHCAPMVIEVYVHVETNSPGSSDQFKAEDFNRPMSAVGLKT